MEPRTPKRPKTPAEEEEEGEDRISALPDPILGLILSRLPTKSAIATTVLSTKWRHLFSFIPNPSIEIRDAEQPPTRSTSFINPSFIDPAFFTSLSRFFNHVLPQFSLVESIDLTLYEKYTQKRIEGWFSTAPPCNLRLLRLYAAAKGCGISSLDVLRPFATSLTRLELFFFSRCNLYDPNTTLVFPNLTWLSLNGVDFVWLSSFAGALAACPSLRRLHLIGCEFPYGLEEVYISVPSLRVLLLCGCYRGDLALIIDTPVLESFFYNDRVGESYPMPDSAAFSSLVTATLNVKPNVRITDFEEAGFHNENMAKLLAAFSTVTALELSVNVNSLALQHEDNFRMPTFPNLTKLDIGIVDIVGWEILAMFLQSSPLLRVLSVFPAFRREVKELALSCHMEYYERFQSRLPDAVPLCLSSHLSEFVFEEFQGDKDDCKLVQYFLRTARVLKKMQICFLDFLSHEVLEIKQYILTSPRSSTNCHIDIVMHDKDTY